MQNWYFIVIAFIIVIAVAFGLLILWSSVGRNIDSGAVADGVQLILLGGLALVTLLYAWSTRQIAQKAEEEAEATRKLAEKAEEEAEASREPTQATLATVQTMEKQRIETFKPRLILRLGGHTSGNFFVKAISVHFTNEGKGSAVNSTYFFKHPQLSFSPANTTPRTIAVEASFDRVFEVANANDIVEGISTEGVVVASYEDVEENRYESRLEIKFDPTTNDARGGRITVAEPVKNQCT